MMKEAKDIVMDEFPRLAEIMESTNDLREKKTILDVAQTLFPDYVDAVSRAVTARDALAFSLKNRWEHESDDLIDEVIDAISLDVADRVMKATSIAKETINRYMDEGASLQEATLKMALDRAKEKSAEAD